MKKTLIALTLASLPVAAMAEVVLYGQIKGGYEVSSTKAGKNDRTPYINNLADYGSRIGFKGQEDLGNGLKAIWQVENKTPLAGGGSWATRDTFIGLEGGFGKVRAGTISNQLNDMGDVDPWEYSSEALGLGKFTRTGTRRVSVRYDSPEFAGFSGNVQFSPRDNNAPRGEVPTQAKYGLGLNYQNSGIFARYGYELLKNNADYVTDGGATRYANGHVHRIEGGYDANNLFVALGYQNSRNVQSYSNAIAEIAGRWAAEDAIDSGATEEQAKAAAKAAAAAPHAVRGQEVALTAGYHFGNIFPKISYAHGWNVKESTGRDKATVKNTKYDQIVIGADYDFSKRTTANVQVGWLREGKGPEVKKSSNTTALGVGLKHKF